MTIRPVDPGRVIRAAAVALQVLSGATGAQAMTVTYECNGHRLLTGEFTPRVAQVHFEGHDWSLVRTRDAGQARYVSARDGIVVVTKVRGLTLTRGDSDLACFLRSDALSPENLGVR